MRFLEFETHSHTKEVSPCSRISAEELVALYHQKGYYALFVTDHFSSEIFETEKMANKSWEEKVDRFMQGYRNAKKAGDRLGVKVLLGLECTPAGSPFDFLIYGADEAFLKEQGPFYRFDIKDIFKLMEKNNKIVFQAHPYRYGLEPEDPAYVHGIEIFNAHPRHQSRNNLALKFAGDHGLWTISGSDTHQPQDAGRSGVMMPEGVDSEAAFVDYYRQNGSPELIIIYS